jgi:hypothetical protein
MQPATVRGSATNSAASRLTVVTTTHLIPSAPSVWILRRTVASLRARLNVRDCEHRVYYDAPETSSPRHDAYLENLRALCLKLGLTLLVRPQSGLKANYLHAVDTVQTPYLLFLEHDWTFRRSVDLPTLLDVFDRHPYVHYVKFNRKANDSRYMWDHFVEPEDRVAELPLTRTSCWSNNPHVVRVSKWREEWRAIVGETRERGAVGIEERLYWAYGRGIFTAGFRETHALWGCMNYGALDEAPLVRHVNGSLSQQFYLEPFAKMARLVHRNVRRMRRVYAR